MPSCRTATLWAFSTLAWLFVHWSRSDVTWSAVRRAGCSRTMPGRALFLKNVLPNFLVASPWPMVSLSTCSAG